jgi:hypothetical protein
MEVIVTKDMLSLRLDTLEKVDNKEKIIKRTLSELLANPQMFTSQEVDVITKAFNNMTSKLQHCSSPDLTNEILRIRFVCTM